MITTYKNILKILDVREKKLALLVLLLSSIVAVIDTLGVASIMPFMAVLINPEVVKENPILFYIYSTLGFESTDSFLFFLGVIVFFMLVGSALLRGALIGVQVYYSHMRVFSISSRLVSSYLKQPYSWFLVNNTSKLTATIIEEVNRVVYGVLHPALRLISNCLIAILLISLFIVVDPVLALSLGVVISLSYVAVFKFVSSRLARDGQSLSEFQRGRYNVIQEMFGGIKDIKLLGLEESFIETYKVKTRGFSLKSSAIKLWAELPTFVLQAIVFGSMMLVILYLMKFSESLEEIIPVMALYALGGYKLMPSLQEVYRQLAEIKGNQSAVDSIIEYAGVKQSHSDLSVLNKEKNRLSVVSSFELRGVSFSYPGSSKLVLDGLGIVVGKNKTVGFVGGSGSGKTTTIDLILGLLSASQGELLVDHKVVEGARLREWQNNIGYVPQQIFLLDDSISSNIAYGLSDNQVNFEAVKKAALAANLHEFIENELPEGYNTVVGERGVRLSGGQRQRVGIARALYSDPEVLVLDEATSALDNVTEKVVMEAVKELGKRKTIIIVAHRLSTVQSCDQIYFFERGKVTASGTYQELLKTSEKFKELALLK